MSWLSKQLNSTGLGGVNQVFHPVNDLFKGTSAFFDKYGHMWHVGGKHDWFTPAFETVGGALAGGSSLWGSSALGAAGAAGAGAGGGAGGLTEFTPSEIQGMGGGLAGAGGAGSSAPSAASGGKSWLDYARQANQLRGYLGNMQGGGGSSQPIRPQPWMLGDPAEQERKRQALMAMLMAGSQSGPPGQQPLNGGMMPGGPGKGGGQPVNTIGIQGQE